MASSTRFSDGALAVFAFAIYHQLESGEPVTAVIREDGAGHQANAGAIEELRQAGVVTDDEDKIVFSASGQEIIGSLIEAMRQGAAGKG